jgi:hypothetical protein
MDKPKTQVEEAKEQINALVHEALGLDPALNPYAVVGKVLADNYIAQRDAYRKFQEDLHKIFNKMGIPEEKK